MEPRARWICIQCDKKADCVWWDGSASEGPAAKSDDLEFNSQNPHVEGESGLLQAVLDFLTCALAPTLLQKTNATVIRTDMEPLGDSYSERNSGCVWSCVMDFFSLGQKL